MRMKRKYQSPRNIALKEIREDIYSYAQYHRDYLKAQKQNNPYRKYFIKWFIQWSDLPKGQECIDYLNSREITKLNASAIKEYENSIKTS